MKYVDMQKKEELSDCLACIFLLSVQPRIRRSLNIRQIFQREYKIQNYRETLFHFQKLETRSLEVIVYSIWHGEN